MSKHLVCFLLTIGFAAVARADLVGLDGKPLDLNAALTVRLEPAKQQLAQGNIAECRRLVQNIASVKDDLPHADVVVAFWLMDAGEYVAGQKLLEQLSRSEPMRQDLRFAFGELARRQGRFFDAWTHFSAAESVEPLSNWSSAYRRSFLDSILLSKALVAERRSDWKSVGTLYTRLNKTQPENPLALFGMGRAAFHSGDLDEAEQHFRQAELLSPGNVCAELELARLYDSQQNNNETEAWFRRGVQSNARHSVTVRAKYAIWLLDRNRPSDALKELNQLEVLEAMTDEVTLVRALAKYMLGEYSEAESGLSQLARKQPSNPAISSPLAWTLAESEDEGTRARALQIAEANTRAFPKSNDIVSSLVWIQFRLGDITTATKNAKAIVQRGGVLSRDSAYFLGRVLSETEQAASLSSLALTSSRRFLNANRERCSDVGAGCKTPGRDTAASVGYLLV